MRIVAVSDLHGTLPEIPPCDLLLIGGDVCPLTNHNVSYQGEWLDGVFRAWLQAQPARKIIGVAGNHDFVFEQRPDLIPRDLPWIYLEDTAINWEDLTIYGSPWQPWFYDWAFNLYEPQLQEKWDRIPRGTDILVLHGPPFGYGDGVPEQNGTLRRTGSPSLLRRIEAVAPKVAIFGHIHEGRGDWQHGSTRLANVTILDANYQHVHPPWVYDLNVPDSSLRAGSPTANQ